MTLTTPVPILQHEGEFERCLELYRALAPKRTLELGTWHGGTLYHWLQNATPGSLVVSIDRHPVTVTADWLPQGVTYAKIAGNTADPQTVRAAAELGPYDWVFVDADHHEAAVRADWEAYRGLVAQGGAMVFHDITPTDDPTIEVDRLWFELRGRYETAEFLDEEGFGIGIAYLDRFLGS